MSIKAVTWAFEQRLDDPTAKLVLLGIADKYNEDRGYSWPSVARLSEMADCTERTVSRKLKYLEEIGLIETIRHPTQTNHYFLPYMTSCRDDTSVRADMTSDVCTDMTPDVSRTIDNNNINNNNMINDAFKRFWEAVPKKVAKKAALTAFKRALKETDAETLIKGITDYSKAMKDKGTKAEFILHPTTWLNQGRWEDEAPAEEPVAYESFGVVTRWLPKDRAEWDSRLKGKDGKDNSDFWLRHWKQNRPDLISLAYRNGWIDDKGKPTPHA